MLKFAATALLSIILISISGTSLAEADGQKSQDSERRWREKRHKSDRRWRDKENAICVPEIDASGAPLAGAIALLALGVVLERKRPRVEA